MEQLVQITKLAGVLALCAGSSALVGCGGSSLSSKTTTQSPVVAQHPYKTAGASILDIGGGSTRGAGGQAAALGSARRQRENVKQTGVSRGSSVKKGRSTPVQSGDDGHPISSNQPNPCRLVSVAEAKVITGGAIAASAEAPLGPTCIYKLVSSKADVTLAVESLSVSQATSHMAKRQYVTVRGRRAYCGNLGAPMLYVPLSGGQILHVTAPCSVAQRFAALALGRLTA
jgi:hypothetical protein